MPEGNLPYTIPGVVRVRTTAILPAAPTYGYSQWIPCRGFRWATFYFTYTRGAAGGAVRFYLTYRPNRYLGEYQMSAYAVGAVAAGVDTISLIQREIVSYTSLGAAAESFIWGPIELNGTAESFKLYWTESVNVQNPGTFGADVQMTVAR